MGREGDRRCATVAGGATVSAALLGPEVPPLSLASSKLREQGADESAKHGASERRVVGTAVSERIGQCEHPLADRHLGQHAIDEMRGRVRHATSAARRAKAATLARERDQAVVAAAVAVQAQEAVREHTAAQERPKFLLDEVRSHLAAIRGTREEAFQLLADDLVQKAPSRSWRAYSATRSRLGRRGRERRFQGRRIRLPSHCRQTLAGETLNEINRLARPAAG